MEWGRFVVGVLRESGRGLLQQTLSPFVGVWRRTDVGTNEIAALAAREI